MDAYNLNVMAYKFKVSSINIVIRYTNNSYLTDYLNKEYKLIKDNSFVNANIIINVFEKRDFKFFNEKGWMKFKAFRRCFYWRYYNSAIDIYLPYKIKNKKASKFLSIYYENKWETCLIDFFHNIFVEILQIALLKKNNTLLHASSFKKKGQLLVLFGKAQSGKSTFAKMLGEDTEVSILSEDFCVCSLNGNLSGLPHQSRIYFYEYLKNKANIDFLDHLNGIIFSLTKVINKKNIRRISFEEIFKKNSSIIMNDKVSRFFILKRDGNEIYENDCSLSEFKNYCLSVLINEFKNIKGLNEVIGDKYLKQIIKQTEKILEKIYLNNNCYELHVPYYDDLNKLSKDLNEFFN